MTNFANRFGPLITRQKPKKPSAPKSVPSPIQKSRNYRNSSVENVGKQQH